MCWHGSVSRSCSTRLLTAVCCYYHCILLCETQVKLNRGLDFVQLDDLLIDLKLTPDVLEVPVPRYFIEDRAQVRVGGCGCHTVLSHST